MPAVRCLCLEKVQVPDQGHVLRQQRQRRLEFPACLAQVYTGYQADVPDTRESNTLVLVTPKAVLLETGQTVDTLDKLWRVTACHTLGDYQNEYRIQREANV